MLWMGRISRQGKGLGWMIRRKGELIGCIRLDRIACTTSIAMTAHAHGTLELHRLEARTLAANPASDGAPLRVGFRCEGTRCEKSPSTAAASTGTSAPASRSIRAETCYRIGADPPFP